MGMSLGHMALLFGIVLLLFGAGKLPKVMGDLAKGIKSFKQGMREGEGEEGNSNKLKLPHDKDNAA